RDFLDVLLAPGFGPTAHPFATLLLTMRADFMGQALAYPPMVAALQDNDVKIGLMADEELRLAIEQPAKNQNVTFAEGLVGRILEDVGEHAGNLPLLEFALTLLWERQSGGEMSHGAYEAIGGVRGALAQHADETLARLTKEEPERARIIQRVMVQLVQPGTGAEDTRRVARKSDLGDIGWALAQRLAAADARLLVTGRDNENAE
ncbi:MAG: WD40 repeat domain-containing protein, partial [Anaerolineae bacterium]|nr:WD40 repeat domain-containing protein [Anaerolineae bacterium]